jgi:hypothetical protein
VRAALRWTVLIVLLSAAGLLAGDRVLSTFMLAAGVLASGLLLVVIRRSQRE